MQSAHRRSRPPSPVPPGHREHGKARSRRAVTIELIGAGPPAALVGRQLNKARAADRRASAARKLS